MEGQGRPRIFNKTEEKIVAKAKSNPIQQIKQFGEELKKDYNKFFSTKTLKCLLKRGNMIWKRMRNYLASKRDEELFQLFRNQASKGEIAHDSYRDIIF